MENSDWLSLFKRKQTQNTNKKQKTKTKKKQKNAGILQLERSSVSQLQTDCENRVCIDKRQVSKAHVLWISR